MSLENEIIDYKENEEDIKYWTQLKGAYRYEKMISFMKSNNLSLDWKNITNYMRYDKRLLFNSFKYVVVVEEMVKSLLYSHERCESDKLLKMEFSTAVTRLNDLNEVITFEGVDFGVLKEEYSAIIDFRNSVVHNKMLLGRDFRWRNSGPKRSLNETLNFFKNIVPNSYREGFVKDIAESISRLNIKKEFVFFQEITHSLNQ